MYKNNKLIITSALISFALSNPHINLVKADENINQNIVNDSKNIGSNSSHVTSPSNPQSNTSNYSSKELDTHSNTIRKQNLQEKIYSTLSGVQLNDLTKVIDSEDIGGVLTEALIYHEDLELDLANEKYLEVINYLEANNIEDNNSIIIYLKYSLNEKNDLNTTFKRLNELETIESELLMSNDTEDNTGVQSKQILENPATMQMNVNTKKKSANDYFLEYKNARQASDAWEIAQNFKRDYPNDNRIHEVITGAADRILILGKQAHQRKDFRLAGTYYNRLLNEKLINKNLLNEVTAFQRQALNNEDISTSDTYYQKFNAARQASDAWEIAQNFKLDYPNDNRVNETINDAAHRNLILGQDAHQQGKFDLASLYYGRLLNESRVNSEIQKVVTIYNQQVNNKEKLKTADDYYQLATNAKQASDAWEYAQQFNRDYPKDKRIEEVLNRAGERNIILGKTAHLNGEFELAISYYDRLINEPDIKEALRKEASRYHLQATSKYILKTADDYYQDSLEAKQASEAWKIGQLFKRDYPNDARVHEVINNAANRNMILGLDSHRSKDFEMAKFYYSRIIDESLVVDNLKTLATGYYNQVTTNRELMTPEDYFDKSLNTYQASDSWNQVQMFKSDFPNHHLLLTAISESADRNFKLGIRYHQDNNYNLAAIYYDRIINEILIEPNMRALATKFKQKASNSEALNTARFYSNSSLRARGASDAWNIALEGLRVHPNSSLLIIALNDAANRNIYLGRDSQRKNNVNLARSYYTKVIGDERVDFSIRNLAKVFRQQLNSSHSPIVYIDPGHGGYDSGASFYGLRERDLNLNVSSILKNELEARGYTVILSRNSNVYLELENRAKEANRMGADIFISVHHNSMGGSGTARGIETFIQHRVSSGFGQETNRANFELNDIRIKESLLLADYIHGDLIRSTGMNNRGVKGNNFNVLRNTDIPAVLLELGFMDNRTESSIIRQLSYQRQASKAIADGIDKYFKGI